MPQISQNYNLAIWSMELVLIFAWNGLSWALCFALLGLGWTVQFLYSTIDDIYSYLLWIIKKSLFNVLLFLIVNIISEQEKFWCTSSSPNISSSRCCSYSSILRLSSFWLLPVFSVLWCCCIRRTLFIFYIELLTILENTILPTMLFAINWV